MKTYTRNFLIIPFIIIVLISVFSFLFRDYISFCLLAIGDNKSQERLLSETDYKLLLHACRELPKPVQKFESKCFSSDSISKNPPEGISGISKKILIDLKANSIVVDERGQIHIEIGTSFSHFGVKAYPEDFNEPFPGYVYGDRELIHSLWYYDEGYVDYPSECKKKIEALIQKNKFR